MKINTYLILGLLALSLLASCQTYQSPPINQKKPIAVSAIDGNWIDTRGINSAHFSNGTFTSIDTNTGKPLARGSYTFKDSQAIDLNFTSLVRNATVNAACLLVTPSQVNCTTATGAQFILVKKAITPAAFNALQNAPVLPTGGL
jgi:hypothetical protein